MFRFGSCGLKSGKPPPPDPPCPRPEACSLAIPRKISSVPRLGAAIEGKESCACDGVVSFGCGTGSRLGFCFGGSFGGSGKSGIPIGGTARAIFCSSPLGPGGCCAGEGTAAFGGG